MTSSCISSLSSNFFPARCFFRWRNKWKSLGARSGLYGGCEFLLDVHLLRWEIVWWNEPRIWRDFGSALPFQTRLTQTKPVLTLSNEHGSQVKDQCWWQCCHNKHKKFPYRPTCDILYFPNMPCIQTWQCTGEYQTSLLNVNFIFTVRLIYILLCDIYLDKKPNFIIINTLLWLRMWGYIPCPINTFTSTTDFIRNRVAEVKETITGSTNDVNVT